MTFWESTHVLVPRVDRATLEELRHCGDRVGKYPRANGFRTFGEPQKEAQEMSQTRQKSLQAKTGKTW